MTKIILASQSPRRKMLLETLGVDFTCVPAKIDEYVLCREKPREAVNRIARQKAEEVASRYKDSLVIAADTIVVYNHQIMGKPEDEEDAFRKLSILSGNSHEVITALCIMNAARKVCDQEDEITRVYFRNITERETRAYIATGEPMDKAGAYGIQGIGSIFISRIEGCYFNVVGLPLSRLYIMLQRQGIDLLGGTSAG
ncbi:MAG: Maf family protein [Syntrophomonadaceae bacterium]|nr:Maf family protein [Syntrophomonadaceae bacterium]MDD3890300.1 Maf family protein [Syntrophomonadaceae bacterium]MDD4549579.1 Maf family protein [Syntrophomonadaceae bacterium]